MKTNDLIDALVAALTPVRTRAAPLLGLIRWLTVSVRSRPLCRRDGCTSRYQCEARDPTFLTQDCFVATA